MAKIPAKVISLIKKFKNKIIDIDTRLEPVVFSFDEYQNQETYGLIKEIKKYGIEI